MRVNRFLTSLLVAATMISTAKAAEVLNSASAVSANAGVSFGAHAKVNVQPGERERITAFYRDVLGCEVTYKSNRDLIRVGSNYYIAFIYDAASLNPNELEKSIWLELRTENVSSMKKKILAFGVKQMDAPDREHLIFQAPGGQVYRLVGLNEDLTKYEQ